MKPSLTASACVRLHIRLVTDDGDTDALMALAQRHIEEILAPLPVEAVSRGLRLDLHVDYLNVFHSLEERTDGT